MQLKPPQDTKVKYQQRPWMTALASLVELVSASLKVAPGKNQDSGSSSTGQPVKESLCGRFKEKPCQPPAQRGRIGGNDMLDVWNETCQNEHVREDRVSPHSSLWAKQDLQHPLLGQLKREVLQKVWRFEYIALNPGEIQIELGRNTDPEWLKHVIKEKGRDGAHVLEDTIARDEHRSSCCLCLRLAVHVS